MKKKSNGNFKKRKLKRSEIEKNGELENSVQQGISEEDEKHLIEIVMSYCDVNKEAAEGYEFLFSSISSKDFKLKYTGKELRDQYKKVLEMSKISWTPETDYNLSQLYKKHGPEWSKINNKLNMGVRGKYDELEIQQRYYKLLKSLLKHPPLKKDDDSGTTDLVLSEEDENVLISEVEQYIDGNRRIRWKGIARKSFQNEFTGSDLNQYYLQKVFKPKKKSGRQKKRSRKRKKNVGIVEKGEFALTGPVKKKRKYEPKKEFIKKAPEAPFMPQIVTKNIGLIPYQNQLQNNFFIPMMQERIQRPIINEDQTQSNRSQLEVIRPRRTVRIQDLNYVPEVQKRSSLPMFSEEGIEFQDIDQNFNQNFGNQLNYVRPRRPNKDVVPEVQKQNTLPMFNEDGEIGQNFQRAFGNQVNIIRPRSPVRNVPVPDVQQQNNIYTLPMNEEEKEFQELDQNVFGNQYLNIIRPQLENVFQDNIVEREEEEKEEEGELDEFGLKKDDDYFF